MRKSPTLLVLICVAALLGGCESRTDRTDSGGVLLSVSDFDGLPIRIAVNSSSSLVQVEEIQVQNVVKDPNQIATDLMNVEIRSYEVTYTRADNGSREPPPFVRGLFGVAPANGIFTVENLPVMGADQFAVAPLADLFFQNGGFDKETGSDIVLINCRLRFFGRTLSGDAVESDSAAFTIEFVP